MTTLWDLMPREMEILRWILAERTNSAIAAQIRVKEKTVEFHKLSQRFEVSAKGASPAQSCLKYEGIREDRPFCTP